MVRTARNLLVVVKRRLGLNTTRGAHLAKHTLQFSLISVASVSRPFQIGLRETSECEMSPVETRWTRQEIPRQVSAGAEHSVALVDLLRPNHRRDIVAYAWGNPANGRLGSQREEAHASPMEVEDLTKTLRKIKGKISSLSAGGTHTLAVLRSGEVAAWGGGEYGQLGDGQMWDRPESVMAMGLQGVRSVSAGARHSVALAVDLVGTHVWGWGFNRWGELGCGDTSVRLQPQRVGGLKGCTVDKVQSLDTREGGAVTKPLLLTELHLHIMEDSRSELILFTRLVANE